MSQAAAHLSDAPYLPHASSEKFLNALEAHPGGVFAVLSCMYFLVTIAQAKVRLLWFDEFITFYIARLGSAAAIWDALSRAIDPNPPLTHLLVMWSMRLFGDGELAVRLPSIIAGWIGIACLYKFLHFRLPVAYAICGVVFYMTTAAFDYSFEARSYALMLAFTMAALVAWQRATEGKHRSVSSLLLATCLGAAISSNYFAVLAFFPIAAGEAVREYREGRIAWHVWAALGTGALPLFFYLPLVNRAVANFAPHAWNKPHLGVISDSYLQMAEFALMPAGAIIGLVVVITLWKRNKPATAIHLSLPAHELTTAAVLIAYPVLGYIVAVVRAGMISPRFVLPFCYGLAIAVAAGSFILFASRPRMVVALLAGLTVLFVAREGFVAGWFYNQREAMFRVRDRLPASNVIVVSDSLLVLPLYHYSPSALASRIVFPIDFQAIRQYKKEDSPEQNLWAGRDVFPVPIVPMREFLTNSPSYLIVTHRRNWLLEKLADDGINTKELPIATDTHGIGGFFPLSHGEIYYFDVTPATNHWRPSSPTQMRAEARP